MTVASATEVDEMPILFSGPMVRAILSGKKTMTRRIINPKSVLSAKQKKIGFEFSMENARRDNVGQWIAAIAGKKPMGNEHQQLLVPVRHPDDGGLAWADCGSERLYCPHGYPGSRLWVRETWAHTNDYDGQVVLRGSRKALYRADEESVQPSRWRPSIFMPRELSRIELEITSVRVERLHGITAKDIIAEGAVERAHDDQFGHNPVSAFDGVCYLDLRSLWAAGWEKINGKGSWAENPWVWVISFERCG